MRCSRATALTDDKKRQLRSRIMVKRAPFLFTLVVACLTQPHALAAQSLTGTLLGTLTDTQGGVLPNAVVRVSSPALLGGPEVVTTDERGRLRFPALPPGSTRSTSRCRDSRCITSNAFGSLPAPRSNGRSS